MIKDWMRSTARGNAPVYAVAGLVTTILTWIAYNVGQLTWRVPIDYRNGGDAMFYMAGIKTDLATGWYEHEPLLGAPYGQVLHDFKTADNLPYVFIDFIGMFGADFGTAMNVYYLLGYPLAALTAVWFLRLVGVSRSLSAGLAVLFALAPYHFVRGQDHMWLGEYWPIPLGLGVVVLIACGRRIWGPRECRGRIVGWLTGPTAGTLLALGMVVMSNSYYGLWTLELIAVAGLVRFIATRDVRAFVGALGAGAWVVAVAVANMLPDMLYARANGANATAVQRLPFEAEVYSFKLAQLILPADYHRIGVLGTLRSYYDESYGGAAEGPVLGLVAAVGLIIALCVAVYTLLAPRMTSLRYTNILALAGLTLVCFLIGTVGGISTFLSFVTSDLRGANRISIFVALLALGVLGLALDGGVRRATGRLRRIPSMVIAVVVAALVVGLGYYDQVPPSSGNYAKSRASFEHDEWLVRNIEAVVPADGQILQIPYMPFPENPDVNDVSYADQLMPFLHSDTLRWSGGAVKGRPKTEWVDLGTKALGWQGLAIAATLAGFDAVLLDTQAFEDPAAVPRAELNELLGPAVVKDGRYRVFPTASLRRSLNALPESKRADIAERLLHPTLARFEPNLGDGFDYPDTLKPYRPRFEVDNAQDTTSTIDLSFDIQSRMLDGALRFTFPDGSKKDVDVTGGPVVHTLRFEAPPGRSTISIEFISGPRPPNLYGADSGPIGVGHVVTADPTLRAEVTAAKADLADSKNGNR